MTAEPQVRSARAIARASLTVGVGSVVSRATGLVRTVVVLGVLTDRTSLADAYSVANNMPNILYELLLGGVLTSALVPLFVERLDRQDHEGVGTVLSVAVVSLGALTVAGVLAAPAIAALLTSQADKGAAMTILLRWFLPQVLFYGLISLMTAILHARGAYAAVAFAPLVNNLVVVAVFLSLPSLTDVQLASEGALHQALLDRRTLHVLGLGTTLGVAANVIALWPAVVRQRAGRGERLRLRFRPSFHHPLVRRLMSASANTAGFAAANQVAAVVVLRVADRAGAGVSTAYLAGYTLMMVPYGLFAASIMTTAIPELARLAHAGARARLRRAWLLGLRSVALVMLPAAGLAAVLGQWAVASLPIGAGRVESTGEALAALGPSVAGIALYAWCLRLLYAEGDSRTPFLANLVVNSVNIVFAVVLGLRYGLVGLGIANTIAYGVGTLLSFSLAARRLGRVPVGAVRPVLGMIAGAVIASVVTAAVVALLTWDGADPPALLVLVVGTVVGALVYLWGVLAFGAGGDLQRLRSLVRRSG